MANDDEEWRPIKGYKLLYEVSDMGRVRSLDRIVVRKNGVSVFKKGRVVKPAKGTTGYLGVSLCFERKGRTYKVHRLVAETFIPNTENKYYVDHINRNPLDNRACNLRWCTMSENARNCDRSDPRYNGLYYEPKRDMWKVAIYVNGKHKHIGRYQSEIYAALMFDRACIKHRIDRKLNFKGAA